MKHTDERLVVIDKSMQVIRNLPKFLAAAHRGVADGTTPLDSAINRCLNRIDKIRKFAPKGNYSDQKAPNYVAPKTDLEKYAVTALREAFEIFRKLQKYQPPIGERQHWNPRVLEPLYTPHQMTELGETGGLLEDGVVETSAPDAIPVEDEKGNDVEISSPHLYAGGLGYRHVNWDAEYLMAVDGSERHHNPFWNPKEATVKPVKHFTKEEIEALNCPSR